MTLKYKRKLIVGVIGIICTWTLAMWGPYASETTVTQGYIAIGSIVTVVGGWLVAERRESRMRDETEIKYASLDARDAARIPDA